jgi:hypothetical protein
MASYDQLLEKKSEGAQLVEKWSELLNFLKSMGFMAEIKTQLEIRPVAKENPSDLPFATKSSIVRKMLMKQSPILSRKLRDEFSLQEMTNERVDLSLLDSSLSKYADEKDAVDLVRSSRKRM